MFKTSIEMQTFQSPPPIFEKLLDPCLKSGYALLHVVREKCTHQKYNNFFLL